MNTWRLKNTLLKNEWFNHEIKEEIKKYMEANEMKWKHDSPKPLGCSKDGHKREVYSNPGLPKEGRKVSDTQPNLTPKRPGKRTAKEAQNQKKKENNKD